MTVEEIERIVALLGKTADEEVKSILRSYLRWNLMPPMIGIQPGSYQEVK
jgi:hypothetical protein